MTIGMKFILNLFLNFFSALTLVVFILSCSKKESTLAPNDDIGTDQTAAASEPVSPPAILEPCSIKRLEGQSGDYPPHTVVRADLNGDTKKDLFFLYGEEDVFRTCVLLKTENNDYKLVHTSDSAYDTIFKFPSLKSGLQLLELGPNELKCGPMEDSLPPLSRKTKSKIRAQYKLWTKGTGKFNFTYNMPDMFPIFNFGLFQKSKIYSFVGNDKIDVTQKITEYKAFKIEVINDVLKNKSLSPDCSLSLKRLLKSL